MRDLQVAHKPPSERVTFLMGELADRRRHESASRNSSAQAQGSPGSAAAGPGAGGSTGYAQMYVGALCDTLADPQFIALCTLS